MKIKKIYLMKLLFQWGVCRIDRVEIKDITPPPDIKDAMEKQMNAERNKRALILQAEGERQSAITLAEGRKEAAIFRCWKLIEKLKLEELLVKLMQLNK